METGTGFNTPQKVLEELIVRNFDVRVSCALAYLGTVTRFSYIDIGV